MAQQIAANTRSWPADDAAARVAGHLRTFWTPAMRRELTAFSAFSASELDPIVVGALDLLAQEEMERH